jgi:hypothetical protein
VKVASGSVTVTVHSLGAKATGPGIAALKDAKGKVLAKAEIPALAAPADLLPKTVDVVLPMKKGAARVNVALGGGAVAVPEITLLNNEVVLPGAPAKPAVLPKHGKRHRSKR